MSSFYATLRRNPIANWFVINLRFLIAYGFIPSGIKKIIGTPFANPGQQGAFMEYLDALYATGFYYEMIGWAQVMAAVLLITQRFATLGALIFLPIIFNIMVLTISTIGSLTPLIAFLMFLGIVFLLFWDYYKWINIFSKDDKLFNIPYVNDYPQAGKFLDCNRGTDISITCFYNLTIQPFPKNARKRQCKRNNNSFIFSTSAGNCKPYSIDS